MAVIEIEPEQGGRVVIDTTTIQSAFDKGLSPSNVAEEFHVKYNTLYTALRRAGYGVQKTSRWKLVPKHPQQSTPERAA